MKWMDLEFYAVLVGTDVVWAKSQGQPWWPSQLLLRSGIELIKEKLVIKSEAATPAEDHRPVSQLLIAFLTDFLFTLPKREEVFASSICLLNDKIREIKVAQGKVSTSPLPETRSKGQLFYFRHFKSLKIERSM